MVFFQALESLPLRRSRMRELRSRKSLQERFRCDAESTFPEVAKSAVHDGADDSHVPRNVALSAVDSIQARGKRPPRLWLVAGHVERQSCKFARTTRPPHHGKKLIGRQKDGAASRHRSAFGSDVERLCPRRREVPHGSIKVSPPASLSQGGRFARGLLGGGAVALLGIRQGAAADFRPPGQRDLPVRSESYIRPPSTAHVVVVGNPHLAVAAGFFAHTKSGVLGSFRHR